MEIFRKTFEKCGNGPALGHSVTSWLLDIQSATEPECMTILETKQIHNSPVNLENVAATVKGNIYRLQSMADQLFSDLSQLFTEFKNGVTKQLKPYILSLNIRTRSCLLECNKLCPDLPQMQMRQQEIIDDMVVLVKCFEAYKGLLDVSMEPFSKALTSLGKAIKAHLEMVQSALVRTLVDMIEDSASELNVMFAVVTVHCLAQDSVWLRKLLIQEGALGALFAICRISKLSIGSIPMTALQVISTLCAESEGRWELERAGGVGVLSEVLGSPVTSELVKCEAASVLAEITSPDADSSHRMLCFIEHMEDLVKNLTALCERTCSPAVFLVGASAIANITFMDMMSSDYLADFRTAEVLIRGYTQGKAPSIYSKYQVLTIIANISMIKSCREQILKSGGMSLLSDSLHTRVHEIRRHRSSGSDSSMDGSSTMDHEGSMQTESMLGRQSIGDKASCEDIYQKAAIALGRLCQDYDSCKLAVDMKVASRLADLCKYPMERNHSEIILIACLTALRRIHSHIGSSPLKETDVKQLIQPRLIESFLHCSTTVRRESFV